MRTDHLATDDPRGLGVFTLLANALTLPPQVSPAIERRQTCADGVRSGLPARRRGILERIDHWFWVQQQRDLEAYLAKARDVYDLEARIRALERKFPNPYY